MPRTSSLRPAASAVRRFTRWSKQFTNADLGRLLAVDSSYIAHLRSGKRMPSLQVAVRVQLATRGTSGGEIHPCEWVGHRPRKASAPAEEAAA